MLFLVLLATAPINAALPVLAILSHMTARGALPAENRHTDLDMIVASAAVGIAWLVAGGILDGSMIMHFNLTFAAATLIFMLVARGSDWRWVLGSALGVASATAGVWHFNETRRIDLPALDPALIAAALLVPLCVMMAARPVAGKYWTARAFLLAAFIPVTSVFLREIS